MTEEEIKKTLEKQLQLLSKRAENAPEPLLIELNQQLVETARLLICFSVWRHPVKWIRGLRF